MEKLYGTVVTGMVTDQNEKAYVIQKEGVSFLLDKEELEDKILNLGDTVEGFVYEDMNRRKRITTNIPDITQTSFGWATVSNVRKDLGVFMDFGLPDKEVVVSLDHLPLETEIWPKKGDRLYIDLWVDKKDRLWARPAEEEIITDEAKDADLIADHERINKDINGIVYRNKLAGAYVLTEDGYKGFIHPDEWIKEPRLGEEVSGRIIGIGRSGAFNISLKPRAHETLDDDGQMIYAMIERTQDGFLPYHDKSSADEIRKEFGISKAQFKRAIGGLYKKGLIKITDHGIYLAKN